MAGACVGNEFKENVDRYIALSIVSIPIGSTLRPMFLVFHVSLGNFQSRVLIFWTIRKLLARHQPRLVGTQEREEFPAPGYNYLPIYTNLVGGPTQEREEFPAPGYNYLPTYTNLVGGPTQKREEFPAPGYNYLPTYTNLVGGPSQEREEFRDPGYNYLPTYTNLVGGPSQEREEFRDPGYIHLFTYIFQSRLTVSNNSLLKNRIDQ